MRTSFGPLARFGWPGMAGAVALAFYLLTISPSIGVLHDTVDSAELVVVASKLGVAHPPGSALWMPLGWAALEWLPFVPEPALRTNLLSAVLMAAAVTTLALATARWRPETPPWAAALAGLLGGLAPLVWAEAIVTEVLALQALLATLALLLVVDASAGRRWAAFALVLGLLSWNHPTGLALAVPLVVGALTLALGLAALAPGGFGTALAQTATSCPSPQVLSAGYCVDLPEAAVGGGPVVTAPSPGGATTTTTLPGGGTQQTTTLAGGGTQTVTVQPSTGTTTTVISTPTGTVTTVAAPNQPAVTTIQVANPGQTSTVAAPTLAMFISLPPNTLTAGEAIVAVQQAVDAFAAANGVDPSSVVVVLSDAVERVDFADERASVKLIRTFDLQVKKADGTAGQLAKPALFTWEFTPAELASAGGNTANMLMIGYNPTTKGWTAAKQVSKTSTSVTFEVPHFSTWAFAVRNVGVVVPPAPPTAAPVVPAGPVAPGQAAPTTATGAAPALTPRPANTGTGIPAEQSMSLVLPMIAAAVLGTGILGGVALRTARRRS